MIYQYQCASCPGKPRFEFYGPFRAHLRAVHQIRHLERESEDDVAACELVPGILRRSNKQPGTLELIRLVADELSSG